MSSFGTRFVGYTGAANEIERLATAFRASYQRRALEGGDYTVDHTTLVYLVDRSGHVVDVIGYQTPPERTDQQLRALMRR
jgi:protein SCO1/2